MRYKNIKSIILNTSFAEHVKSLSLIYNIIEKNDLKSECFSVAIITRIKQTKIMTTKEFSLYWSSKICTGYSIRVHISMAERLETFTN